jgi:hypothetical protein
LTTASLRSVAINKFGSVSVSENIGQFDTVNEAAIDYTLSTFGTWTSD